MCKHVQKISAEPVEFFKSSRENTQACVISTRLWGCIVSSSREGTGAWTRPCERPGDDRTGVRFSAETWVFFLRAHRGVGSPLWATL